MDSYYEKYLKYKNKYIQLKKQIGGNLKLSECKTNQSTKKLNNITLKKLPYNPNPPEFVDTLKVNEINGIYSIDDNKLTIQYYSDGDITITNLKHVTQLDDLCKKELNKVILDEIPRLEAEKKKLQEEKKTLRKQEIASKRNSDKIKKISDTLKVLK
jgi:hypothetical protein